MDEEEEIVKQFGEENPCPGCGEDKIESLLLDMDNDIIHCSKCSTMYDLLRIYPVLFGN